MQWGVRLTPISQTPSLFVKQDYRVPAWWAILIIGLLWVLSGCSPAETPASEAQYPEDLPKQLATVYISPTPGDDERRATTIASRPTITVQVPTAIPTATVYVGVFLGDSSGEDGGGSLLDPAVFEGTLIANIPTLEAPTCLIPTDPLFGTNWAANSTLSETLACAGEPVTSYVGTTQIFERGVMYFIPSGEIWVIAPGGTSGGQYWYVPQAPPDQGWEVPPPEGLRMPTLGFGAVWKAVDGVRQTLGFARTDEQAASISIQRFDGGALFLDSSAGQTFALIGDQSSGTAYGPF
jgi:hypothetical protein